MYATVVYVRVDLSNMMSVAFPQALPYGLRQANYGQSSMSEMASLEYLAGAQIAGIVLGARVPMVLTSRADKAPARLVSCAIARLLARNNARSERLGA
jgi:prolipoprotein diacylglyceryltransferase